MACSEAAIRSGKLPGSLAKHLLVLWGTVPFLFQDDVIHISSKVGTSLPKS